MLISHGLSDLHSAVFEALKGTALLIQQLCSLGCITQRCSEHLDNKNNQSPNSYCLWPSWAASIDILVSKNACLMYHDVFLKVAIYKMSSDKDSPFRAKIRLRRGLLQAYRWASKFHPWWQMVVSHICGAPRSPRQAIRDRSHQHVAKWNAVQLQGTLLLELPSFNQGSPLGRTSLLFTSLEVIWFVSYESRTHVKQTDKTRNKQCTSNFATGKLYSAVLY